MIFEDFSNEKVEGASGDDARGQNRSRRRRRRSSGEERGEGSGRRRRRRSSFDEATLLPDRPATRDRASSRAWFWVLGLLVAASLGFGFALHLRQNESRPLGGDPPSSSLQPFVDPVLAPLETGMAGCPQGALGDLEQRFQAERARAEVQDQEIYQLASVIALLLADAEADRGKHLERLADLEKQPPSELPSYKRQQFAAAISVSWQRNSVEYRNRLEELWIRLSNVETGRFGAAPTLMDQPPRSYRQ